MKSFVVGIGRNVLIVAILFFAFVAVGILAAASNKLNINQIFGPSTGPALFGWLANGTPAFIKPGTGLSIDASGNLNATGSAVPNFADYVPFGTPDGTTKVFALPNTPNPASSLGVFKNGQLQMPGTGNDYTVAGNQVTFTVAPVSGDQLQASFRF